MRASPQNPLKTRLHRHRLMRASPHRPESLSKTHLHRLRPMRPWTPRRQLLNLLRRPKV
ncbi:hypothetical protein QJS10_CPA08g00077 [Acorus calamus]|uniref:Uncharacterized protein n=1 Tax=Acorus calamus TaxID=4465 RepID=A0AAV9E8Q5_ACOCL|nr:hypothetical protein QJS10_CPA08g00077 [Acorus calamus]